MLSIRVVLFRFVFWLVSAAPVMSIKFSAGWMAVLFLFLLQFESPELERVGFKFEGIRLNLHLVSLKGLHVALQGEIITARLPGQALNLNVALGALRFLDGSQKALAGFIVWIALLLTFQHCTSKDDLENPNVQALCASLLRIRTVAKQGTGSDELENRVFQIVKQNLDSKVQPVSSLAWASILRSVGQSASYEAATHKYNSHPEVKAMDNSQGGSGAISLDNKKKQAQVFSLVSNSFCTLFEECFELF